MSATSWHRREFRSLPTLILIACFGILMPQTGHGLISFGKVRAIDPSGQAVDDGRDSEPRVISLGAGVWVAAWYSENPLGGTIGTDFDILFSRSTDDGQTWWPLSALNTNATSDGAGSDGSVDIAVGMSGVVLAVWSSSAVGGTAVARSTDGGQTWSAPVAMAGFGGTEYRLATDGAGTWIAVWGTRNYPGGGVDSDDDIYWSRSTDNGLNWSVAAALNSDAATDGIKDDSAPEIAWDGIGVWMVTWNFGGNHVAVSSSSDNASTWSVAQVVAADPDDGRHPNIATDGAGKWLVVWSDRDDTNLFGGGTDRDLFLISSVDDGLTWSIPTPVGPNALSDGNYENELPTLIRDDAGVWYLVSSSSDPLTGVKNDRDLFISRSFDNGDTWTSHSVLNTTANTDAGLPSPNENNTYSIAYDSVAKRWVAVWRSRVRYDGKMGTDWDIVAATSSDDCPQIPSPGCRSTVTPGRSRLNLKDHRKGNDLMKWTWRGEATSHLDYSDPTIGTDYVLCTYDQSAGGYELVAEHDLNGGESCKNGAACWSATPGKDFRYKDADLDHGAVKKARLLAGDVDRSRISILAKGAFVSPPRLPLDQDASVVVELHNLDTGICWAAAYSSNKRNGAEDFKAESD